MLVEEEHVDTDSERNQGIVHVRDQFDQLVIHHPASRGEQTAVAPSVADRR